MAELKESTAEQHRLLERVVDAPRACRDRGSYRALLEAFYGFYGPLEESLSRLPWPEAGPDAGPARKVPLIEADLRALGLDRAGLGSLPRCGRISGCATLDRGLGVRYVVEGAAVGGRIIARLVERSLGLTATSGASFFVGHGEATGDRWRRFGLLAEHYVAVRPEARGPMAEAAVETFLLLRRWFETRAGPGGPAQAPPCSRCSPSSSRS